MAIDWTQTAITVGTSVVVAGLSSLLTVRLSLGQFRTQKWWERKEAAYSQAIEALIVIQDVVDAWVTSEELGRDIDDQRGQEYRTRYQEGWRQVRRAIGAGTFIFSDRATEILHKLRKEAFDNTDTYIEALWNEQVAVAKALAELRKEAAADLQVSSASMRVAVRRTTS